MSLAEQLSPPPIHDPGILERLRRETAEDHRELESALDLLAAPLEAERFRHVLGRFFGFHLAWEPAVEAALGEPLGLRSRLGALRQDLTVLGLSARAIDALPACPKAAALAADADRAFGSLYVMEGSTLGGKVIGRALAGAPWLPRGGLHYFDPYGSGSGFMWASLRRRLAARSSPTVDAATVAGARAAFRTLQAWLPA